MDDLKTLQRARMYIAAMSCGVNPLTGEKVSETDTLANDRIQKCCGYVVEILDGLIKKQVSRNKIPFCVTQQQAEQIFISSDPVGINEIAKRINTVTDSDMTNITGAKIASWLVDIGYLDVKTEEISEKKIKKTKLLNSKSELLGIAVQSVTDKKTGEVYDKFMYNENAQRFIISHLNEIK